MRSRLSVRRLGGAGGSPPRVSSASADGDVLTVRFRRPVFGFSSGDEGFTLSASGGAVTAAYDSGDGTLVVTFTLSRPLDDAESVTLGYAPGDIVDAKGLPLEAFSGLAVSLPPVVLIGRFFGGPPFLSWRRGVPAA